MRSHVVRPASPAGLSAARRAVAGPSLLACRWLVAAAALLFLSGTVQLVALGMAVVDAVLVPVLLTQGLDG